jgi:hypothetical protein
MLYKIKTLLINDKRVYIKTMNIKTVLILLP